MDSIGVSVFAKQFGKLDSKIQKRVEEAILTLLTINNPAHLGKYKQNKRECLYTTLAENTG